VIEQLIGGVGSALTGAFSSGLASAKAAQPSAPFSDVLQSLVGQTSALDTQASQTVVGLLSGQGVELHDAMIATQKADMAFELALQVRNKAVGAYQQMLNMQF
jgi:flagellar hook-basal body complex protein FliE